MIFDSMIVTSLKATYIDLKQCRDECKKVVGVTSWNTLELSGCDFLHKLQVRVSVERRPQRTQLIENTSQWPYIRLFIVLGTSQLLLYYSTLHNYYDNWYYYNYNYYNNSTTTTVTSTSQWPYIRLFIVLSTGPGLQYTTQLLLLLLLLQVLLQQQYLQQQLLPVLLQVLHFMWPHIRFLIVLLSFWIKQSNNFFFIDSKLFRVVP